VKRGDTQETGPIERHNHPLQHHVRFAASSPSLARYISGYHGYVIDTAPGARSEETFFPAWAVICFQISGERWAMRIGGRRFDPIPGASLFGPTTYAGFAEFGAGVMIGAGITPCGWARLIGRDASTLTDQIVPLSTLFGDRAAALHAEIIGARGFDDQIAVLERFLLARLTESAPEPPEIFEIQQLLADPAIGWVEQASAALGMPGWKFARLCRRYFGFPPKRLIRRARFIRTMMKLHENPALGWTDLLDPAYHDQSHFIRDCRDFFGMTPGQILARTQPVGATSMAERTRVLGAPVQVLQR